MLPNSHVRRNIKEFRSLNIPDDVQVEILNDVFGKRVEVMFVTGLVDSEIAEEFKKALDHLVSFMT